MIASLSLLRKCDLPKLLRVKHRKHSRSDPALEWIERLLRHALLPKGSENASHPIG
jgi:hypothetical protein